jgi:N-acetylmuramoyl-L-alanine amidase
MRRRDRARLWSRERTGVTGVSLPRRRALSWLVVPAVPLSAGVANGAAPQIASARLWPAQEYTRLILESAAPIEYQLVLLGQPNRVVLDLARVDATPELAKLPARVQSSDPYIAAIRIGTPSGGFLRVVLDVKSEVNPQVFALKPVAEFGHRLVVDLYPPVLLDPLMALLESEARRAATALASEPLPAPLEVKPAPPSAEAKAIAPPAPEARAAPPARPSAGASAVRPSPPVAAARRITIAIDPGHGGEDPGAIGRRGTYEKHVTLAIARKLKSILDAEPNMRAMLTRDDDYFVPLRARVQKARRVQADLFISIHADAFREANARGSSVFALSEHGATSAAARWLAQKENAADLIGGVNIDVKDPMLARTLLDLSQTAQISDSLKVGRQVLEGIGTHNTLHKATVEQAGFAVLKAPDIPSILVETAFISNPDEEMMLRSARHQQKFADSIAAGVKRYFARNPPLARA